MGSGQVGESCFDAFAEGFSGAGAAARICQVGIGERQAVVEDQAVAPANHAEEANEFGGGLRYRHHVGWVVHGLDALHDGGCEATQGTFRVVLLFKWTLDGVGEEESFALKFGKQCRFPRICSERNSCRLHELFEKPPGTQGAIGGIQSGAVEVVFDTRRRRSIEEKDADSSRAQAGGKFKPRGTACDVSVVRSCPASLANRQAAASAQERRGSERMSREWRTMQIAQ